MRVLKNDFARYNVDDARTHNDNLGEHQRSLSLYCRVVGIDRRDPHSWLVIVQHVD